jgi:plasmid replication initiation protein
MSKLEQKLIELGYKTAVDTNNVILGIKQVNKSDLVIKISNKNEIEKYIWSYTRYFETQQDIDNLQQAFNQLQFDLKELKEDE